MIAWAYAINSENQYRGAYKVYDDNGAVVHEESVFTSKKTVNYVYSATLSEGLIELMYSTYSSNL